MNKIAKITGWILGLLGLVLGGWCLASGDATNTAPVDVLLRFTYILFIAAVVILLGLAVIKSAANDPKGLVKALIFIVIAAALVIGVYFVSPSECPSRYFNGRCCSFAAASSRIYLVTL